MTSIITALTERNLIGPAKAFFSVMANILMALFTFVVFAEMVILAYYWTDTFVYRIIFVFLLIALFSNIFSVHAQRIVRRP